MVPPTGMEPEKKPMTPAERMQARFPQPVRVGDLIGRPLLDDSSCTLGRVREVVRTADDKIELIVAYGGLLGWGARLVAVPIEVVGIQGGELPSLDMPRSEYAAAPTWRNAGARAVARRRDDQDRAGAALSTRSRLGEVYNFLVFADLSGVSRN